MVSSNRSHAGAGVDRIGAPNDPIIKRLWERRIGMRLSLTETAKRAGVSRAVISTAENGIHNPRLDIVRAWAGVLGLELDLRERL